MAAADIFVKLEGPDLKGSSLDDKHKDEIEVNSFAKGVSQQGSFGAGGGGGTGKANFSDYTFSKYIDKSSAAIEEACTKGTHYDKVTITCRKAGGKQEEYYIVTLEKAIISSYSLSVAEGGGRPMESFSINFDKVGVVYKEQDEQGAVTATVSFDYNISAQV